MAVKNDHMEWKLLESTYLHKEPWLTLRIDKCQAPDGRIIEPYYVLEYPDWVKAMAMTAEGREIGVRPHRHALRRIRQSFHYHQSHTHVPRNGWQESTGAAAGS